MAEIRLSPALQQARDAIDRAIEGMTEEQLSWHSEGKWSSAGILEHLSLAYGRTTERMKPVAQQGTIEVRRATFKERVGGLIVLKLGRIPAGRKAPEGLSPKGASPGQAITSIRQNLSAMDEVFKQCEARFGDRKIVLVHAILGPLSVRDWRRFHCVHTLHHMRQIHGLRQQMKDAQSPTHS